MARLAEDKKDKALWLTLAQSWVRLAEHVARVETGAAVEPDDEHAAVTLEVALEPDDEHAA